MPKDVLLIRNILLTLSSFMHSYNIDLPTIPVLPVITTSIFFYCKLGTKYKLL